MNKIIFLNGPPGSGKDTIANILIEKYNGVNLKYTYPIRNAVCSLFNISESELDTKKNQAIDIKKSSYRIRDVMIAIGEDIIKPNISKDWFAEQLLNSIQTQYQDRKLIVISDLGFIRELEVVYSNLKDTYDFELWKIYRTGKDFSRDSRRYIDYPIKTRNISNFYSLDVLKELITIDIK